jgi:hypothetical protein
VLRCFFCLICYACLDAGGFGLAGDPQCEGARGERILLLEQRKGIALVLDANCCDKGVGGVRSFISPVGSWAVFAVVVSGAVALLLSRRIAHPAGALLVGSY